MTDRTEQQSINLLFQLAGQQLTIVAADEGIFELSGWQSQQLLSGEVRFEELFHADDLDVRDRIFLSRESLDTVDETFRIYRQDNSIKILRGRSYSFPDSASDTSNIKLVLYDPLWLKSDIVDSMLLQNFTVMMETSNDYIYFKDRNHVFTGASQTLVELTDPTEHWTDLIGLTDYDVFPKEYADIYYRLEKRVFAGETVASEIQPIKDNQGKEGWVDNRKYPIKNAQGEIIGLFGIARDITELKSLQMELERRVNMDCLTELANRKAFMERAELELARVHRYSHPLTVLMIDLDHFKQINDEHGHLCGDAVLKSFAKLCVTTMRKNDLAARIGGEEFALLLPETDIIDAVEIARRLQALAYDDELTDSNGAPIHYTISIGVTGFSDHLTIDEMLNHADTALYEAKNTGRNKICLYDDF